MTGGVAKRQKIRVRPSKGDPPCSNQSCFPMRVVSVGWGVTQSPYTPVIEMLPWGVVRQVAMCFG